MQELITRLTEKAGISADQAHKSLETIKDFVKEKFPMLAGAVDNMFTSSPETTTTSATTAADTKGSSFMDKISDVIPGETGEKVEEFAKNAAEKIEGFFHHDKK